MNRQVHRVLCTAFCFVVVFLPRITAQDIHLPKQQYTFIEIVETIEAQSKFTVSFSSDRIQSDASLNWPLSNYRMHQILNILSENYKLTYEVRESDNRIVLIANFKWTISGKVKDKLSNESLQGVNISTPKLNNTITNEDGFFSLTDDFRNQEVRFSYLGYRADTLRISDYLNDEFQIELVPENVIQAIIIKDTSQVLIDREPEKHIQRENIEESAGIGGTPDVFAYVRHLPGVSVGSEGQNGLIVRGGGPEQNLILLDGLPIYEASHLGGLSSIFISDAVKNIDFYKSGFPARFGGKLSSVLDVRLKEGHRSEFQRSVNFGLEGIQGHIEGPLGEKTSINLNGKISWFSLITTPLLKSNLEFDDSSLNYSDAFAKITHWFSPSNRLSFSFYRGSDLIRLIRDQNNQSQNFSIEDFNRIEWGNTLYSVNWNRTVSDKVFSNTSVGLTSFNYSSRGSYNINYTDIDSSQNNSFDIFSISKLKDINLTQSFDYYSNNAGIFKLGISYISHDNAPSIKESDTYLDSSIQSFIALDSTYLSHEILVFAENRINLKDKLSIHSGVRINYFGGLDKQYFYVQPRINLNYKMGQHVIGVSYARMSQFIHLLVNPGPGLPSDLWVPSTAKVAPELSDVLAFRYRYANKKISFSLSPFYNKYYNVIDYSNVSDILYSLIIDNQLFNVTVDNRNWEDRISAGEGTSFGVETQFTYQTDAFSLDLSYTISKSDRKFSELNRGESYPYKYDRRHNISSRIVYRFSKNKSIHVSWVFGTGNAFTLATDEIIGPDGEPRLVPISRNNGRVPDYHHLDINYTIKKSMSNGAVIQYNFGVYNVYNRLNPFYVYLFQNPETKEFEGFRKISIYPIIPQVNIKYSW